MEKRERVFQIIVWGICLVLLIGLIALVISDKKKRQKQLNDIQLQKELQSEDSENNRNENLDKAASIFDELISETHLNSFVCWGDREMVGIEETSLSFELERVLNERISSLFADRFNEVMEQKNRSVPSISVTNMGVENEKMEEILVRAGVHGIEVGEWALIPSASDPINLQLRDEESKSILHFARQENADFGHVVISGIEGFLTEGDKEYDEEHPMLAFVRDEDGNSIQVGAGTEVEIESATMFIGDIPILFFGDEIVDSEDDFVADLVSLVERYTEFENDDAELSKEQPYVVICTVDKDSSLDRSLRNTFGDHYIRNDTYVDNMTSAKYEAMAELVYMVLDKQGCFEEINTKIGEAVEKLNDL